MNLSAVCPKNAAEKIKGRCFSRAIRPNYGKNVIFFDVK
jgi:hypothetical protein